MSLYQFTLRIDEIVARSVTERKIIRNTGRNEGDEVSFTTFYGGSNDPEISQEKRPVFEDYIRFKKGDVKQNINLLSTTIDLDANESVFATVNVSDDDDINWINFLKGVGELGKAVFDGARGILSRDFTAIVQALVEVVQGSIKISDAVNEQGAETIAIMNLGIQVKDGRPTFEWRGAFDQKNQVQTSISSRFLEDNSIEFLAQGERSEYRIRLAAQFDPATRQANTTSSLEGSSQSKLLLYGLDSIDGIGNELDNALIGNHANNRLLGLAGQDLLNGGGGIDQLDGGTGTDSMFGGAGDDIYEVDQVGDVAIEYLDEGIDTINALVSYLLRDNIENLVLLGSEAIDGTGNSLDNQIIGNSVDNRLSGLEGNDSLLSGEGNDQLLGGNGNDRLEGGAGADLLFGDAGVDFIDGGAGIDTVYLSDAETSATANLTTSQLTYLDALGTVSVEGIFNVENVVGSQHNDVILGSNINNQLEGGGGNDRINGGDGNDILKGGANNDTLNGGNGADLLDGGAGIDGFTLEEISSAVQVDFAAGSFTYIDAKGKARTERILNMEGVVATDKDDLLKGDGNNNYLYGQAGNDRINGGDGDDTLSGGDGIDHLDGGAGLDLALLNDLNASAIANAQIDVTADLTQDRVIYTYKGRSVQETIRSIERLKGTALRDRLLGDEGDNQLDGDAGNDQIEGGAGNDWLTGGAGVDILDGGEGVDIVLLGDITVNVIADLTTDQVTYRNATGQRIAETIRNIESIISGSGNDTLVGDEGGNLLQGGSGDDILRGGAGDDNLVGGAGVDQMDGGTGNDLLNLGDLTVGATIDLAQGRITYVDGTTESIRNMENMLGTQADDLLIGDATGNWLNGSLGNDTLTGGAGGDVFSFYRPEAGLDIVTDFNLAEGDKLQISARGFDPILPGGILQATRFAIGATATTANHRIIYNPLTGALLFDADGTGTIATVQFAQLAPNLNLTHAQIGVTV